MYNRLISYFNRINFLHDNQFGFRKNHSTFHALILIVDKIQRAMEEGNYSCGIFIDISKAFDTVNHNILLGKLERYGSNMYSWYCQRLVCFLPVQQGTVCVY